MKPFSKSSKLYRTMRYSVRHRKLKLDNYQQKDPAARNWSKYQLMDVK